MVKPQVLRQKYNVVNDLLLIVYLVNNVLFYFVLYRLSSILHIMQTYAAMGELFSNMLEEERFGMIRIDGEPRS